MAVIFDKIMERPLSPWQVGLCAGLYPLLFYAGNNFSLVNSWGHLVFFTAVFLVLPVAIAVMGTYILKRTLGLRWVGMWLAFLDRKSTRLNFSHSQQSRMPSSA